MLSKLHCVCDKQYCDGDCLKSNIIINDEKKGQHSKDESFEVQDTHVIQTFINNEGKYPDSDDTEDEDDDDNEDEIDIPNTKLCHCLRAVFFNHKPKEVFIDQKLFKYTKLIDFNADSFRYIIDNDDAVIYYYHFNSKWKKFAIHEFVKKVLKSLV
jgi:hypothetical protein